jgi:dTDP-4-amino-4,6-dideoxygalactose transaminase
MSQRPNRSGNPDPDSPTAAPDSPIYVTRPALPPLSELLPMLEEIWRNRMLTNFGPIHQRFEKQLAAYLSVEHMSLVANATLGLILAAMHLELAGEVITTPFSFVATGHALLWAGVRPVFVDIDRHTMNIDPGRIERAITPRTKAILAVHCFGHACDVTAIKAIAERHGLKVIYDAAHAFGVRTTDGASILSHGDLSVVSFHATKVFNSFEGGAVISPAAASKQAIDRLANYGIVDESTIDALGLNAKMSEVHAAMGLAQLAHVETQLAARRRVDQRYRELLADVPGVVPLRCPEGQTRNYYAFPVLIGPEFRCSRDELLARLRTQGVNARRYFYPLLPDLPMYRQFADTANDPLDIARDVSARILCLPMYADLADHDVLRIVQAIRTA